LKTLSISITTVQVCLLHLLVVVKFIQAAVELVGHLDQAVLLLHLTVYILMAQLGLLLVIACFILTSTTGTTFTAQTSGTAQNLIGIAKLSTTTWIAVGASGTILTSPNAVTWTARSSGTSAELRSVAVANLGGGTYKALAVGTGGIGVSSADGTTWSSAISNSGVDASGNTVSLSDLNSVAYYTFTPAGGTSTTYWLITGNHGIVATTTAQ
jgi:hypothetical protein